jgi:membrane-bound serine protease (ClpP class)
MSDLGTIVLLFTAGMAVLVAELFIPSHGLLTIVGLGFVVAGIVMTFRSYGETAGTVAIIAALIALPTFGLAAIRIWPKTWIGRKIAPPNPTFSVADTSVPAADLSRYIGRAGRTVSPLRPVGVCEFDGRRISCIAEYGILDAGVAVEGLRITGSDLVVREKKA